MLAGFALQPVAGGLLGFFLFPLVDYTARPLYGGRPSDPLDAGIGFGVGIAVVSVLVTAFGAFPILIWRLKHGAVSRTAVLVSGVVLGNLPGAVVVAALAAQGLGQTGVLPGFGDLTYGVPGAVRAIALGSSASPARPCSGWWQAPPSPAGQSAAADR